MRKVLIALLLFCVASCGPLDECLQRSGSMTSRPVEVTPFDRILVNRGIALVISEGPEYDVQIVSGDNLINDISVTVTDGRLTLSDESECNWRRAYGVTTVYVTTPTLKQIDCQGEQRISSGNTLHFPNLHLTAIGNGTSDFYLDVDNDETFIETNNVSGFYLTGRTQNLVAAFYEGNGPLFAADLEAQHVYVFHRSSNHMRIKPIAQLTGDIWSTGNVYCHSQPPVIDINRHYTGRLILE